MSRPTKRDRWKPVNSVRVILFRRDDSKTGFDNWRSARKDDPFHLYLSDTKINGRVSLINQSDTHPMFDIMLSLPQFIALGRSHKATLVCQQLKLSFSPELLNNLGDMADELETKSNKQP